MHLPAAHMLDLMVELSSAQSRVNIAVMLNDLLGSFVLCRHRNPEYRQLSEIMINEAHGFIHFQEPPPFIIPAVVSSARFYVDWAERGRTLVNDKVTLVGPQRRTIIIEISEGCFVCLTECETYFEASYTRRRKPNWCEVNADEGRLSVPRPKYEPHSNGEKLSDKS